MSIHGKLVRVKDACFTIPGLSMDIQHHDHYPKNADNYSEKYSTVVLMASQFVILVQ